MTAPRAAAVEPGYFHRLAIVATPEQNLSGWLREVLGARYWPTSMRQVQGLPFGSESHGRSDESGAHSEMLWLGRTPLCLLIAADSEGMLGHYVARYGTGLHSVAWTIYDMWGASVELERRGVRVTGIDLPGRHFFLHPADTAGLLIEVSDTEFTEDPRDGIERDEPEQPAAVVAGAELAWMTVTVADAAKSAAVLGDILTATPVAGLPAENSAAGDTSDLAIGDAVFRLVAPTDPSSKFAEGGLRLHSICLSVPDLAAARQSLVSYGIGVEAEDETYLWTRPADTLSLRIQWVQADRLPPRG
ncbi:MAG: hypothetical protein JWO63_1741 [Frankiales bacterium]|nr:hypothetical protein [Frankiales bacterium]